MIGRLAALILLSTFSQTKEDEISLTVVKPGDNVTLLKCSLPKNEVGLFYWYKLSLGYMVQTVALGTFEKVTLQGQFINSRFSATKADAVYFLNIANVSKEDKATYFCQAGSAYEIHFINGTVLTVNDQQKSIYVKQDPPTVSVQPGKSATLQCSLLSEDREDTVQCPGEHNVHWFRAGSGESRPGIIYTHRNESEEQENRTCVYRLSKTIRDSSDSGTYYCAVVTCGHILFGEGTQVETSLELCPVFIALGSLLGCCVAVIITLILRGNQSCRHCEGDITSSNHMDLVDRSVGNHANNVDDDHAAALNYVALDFPSRRTRRSNINSELPQGCVYSVVSR